MKRISLLIYFLTIISIIFFLFNNIVQNYKFRDSMEYYFSRDDLNFELTAVGWMPANDYAFNKKRNVSDQMVAIMKWQELSPTLFERGGEYPYFEFNITSSDQDMLCLTIVIHRSEPAIKIKISQGNTQVDYIKKIMSNKILNELIMSFQCRQVEIYENGNGYE